MSRGKRIVRFAKFAALAAALFLLLDLSGVLLYYHRVMRFADNQPARFRADAAVIFFGDYEDKKFELGEESLRRAARTLELLTDSMAVNVICVGGNALRSQYGWRNLLEEYFILHGVDRDHVFGDSVSFNTISNWREAKKIMDRQGFSTLVIVSSPLHVFRISRLVDREEVYYYPYRYQFRDFEDYWDIVVAVHHEWVSFALSALFKEETRDKVALKLRAILRKIT
jgi:uncharacterized SAM-binding protein YcdF (DUF218 family)